MATSASIYNTSRTTRQVLKRHRKEPPSFVLHLHPTSFRIERHNGSFLYDSNLKQLLLFIRDQKVPADLIDVFDEARIPFFEACLIVEILDHRPPDDASTSSLTPSHLNRISSLSSSTQAQADVDNEEPVLPENRTRAIGGKYGFFKRMGIDDRQRQGLDAEGRPQGPNVYRVVLYPTAETLWTDLRTLNETESAGLWSDDDMLQVESRILSLTTPPLCLTPDVQVSRVANLMLSATALPSSYTPLPTAPLPYHRQASRKRGINSIEVELVRAKRKRREAIMRLMDRGSASAARPALIGGTSKAPPYSRMAFIEKWRTDKANAARGVPPTPVTAASGADDKATEQKSEEADTSTAPPPKKKKKQARKSDEKKEPTPPPVPTTPAKKKSKKQLQKEKEEREKAEREQAEQEAARKKEEEEASKKKKSKKSKKKTDEAVPEAPPTSAAKGDKKPTSQKAPAASAPAKKGTVKEEPAKKPTKSKKKADAEGGKAAGSSVTPKQSAKVMPMSANAQNAGFPQQTQQQLGNMMPQNNLGMFGQQSMAGFPIMQGQGMPQGANGLGGFGAGNPFANMNNVGGAAGNNMGQTSNAGLSHYQLAQQQLAIQRAMQSSGVQMPQQGNTMMGNAGGANLNTANLQQQMQVFAAMQAQQQQQKQGGQQQTQGGGDLPVGIGLGNLPMNWGNMG